MRKNPNRIEDNASTAAMLKSRIGVSDVLAALMLATDLGDMCPDPHCERVAIVTTRDGQGWRCTECGASGDIFTMVMLKHDKDFPQARRWIEERVLPARKDRLTGDLFSESAARDSGKAGRAGWACARPGDGGKGAP